MPNDRIRGGAVALLFCLITVSLMAGCHQPDTIYTTGPQFEWRMVSFRVCTSEQRAWVINDGQQFASFEVSVLDNISRIYVPQFRDGLGCHRDRTYSCKCSKGDQVHIMLVVNGDTTYNEFILGN